MGLRGVRQRWGAGRARVVLAVAALAITTAGTFLVQARTSESSPPVDVSTVSVSALPPQGQVVMGQILAGGPFRYEKDGSVFFNRERLLPGQKRGYYREYTVPTPGLSHRGARRIVCGGEIPKAPEACFYTEDHYGSFKRIAQ